jgi:hypothetical protein
MGHNLAESGADDQNTLILNHKGSSEFTVKINIPLRPSSKYFPYFEKLNEVYKILLCVALHPNKPEYCSQKRRPLLGNGSLSTFPWQRIHMEQKNNCRKPYFPCGPCRFKYSVCSESKVGYYFSSSFHHAEVLAITD